MAGDPSRGPWADRAAALYDVGYARHYRDHDAELLPTPSNQGLIDWLGETCDRFDRSIDVLDLGCGTGRYFWGLRRVRTLVGLDASEAMLVEARHPVHQDRVTAESVTLVNGDLMLHEFAAATFDLVYSIGVLAEHVPLDAGVIARVRRWLRPGGRFAFTTVHPSSSSVTRTWPRRAAEWALPMLPDRLSRPLHHRLVDRGRYADERWLTEQLAGGFVIESLTRFQTDVHLHGLCVARKEGR